MGHDIALIRFAIDIACNQRALELVSGEQKASDSSALRSITFQIHVCVCVGVRLLALLSVRAFAR